MFSRLETMEIHIVSLYLCSRVYVIYLSHKYIKILDSRLPWPIWPYVKNKNNVFNKKTAIYYLKGEYLQIYKLI